MRTNAITAEVATKLKNYAKRLDGVTVQETFTSKDQAILHKGGRIVAWLYAAKTGDGFIVAWREDEETDWLVEQLLKQVA